MERYICENVFVPLRSGPAHKSEMLSQILFGEKYSVIDKSGKWMKIETLFDSYRGWIDMDHLMHTAEETLLTGQVLNKPLICYRPDKTKLILEAGCEIYEPNFDDNSFLIGQNRYSTSPEFDKSYISTSDSLPDIALRFMNSAYLWGGRLQSGIDCSGLTQLTYKIYGVPIPRDSIVQSEIGEAVDFIEEAVPGDLAFFDNEKGRISHVGMIISRGQIIHSSGRVRIDPIDHQGIYKNEIKAYSHHLRTIRRIR